MRSIQIFTISLLFCIGAFCSSLHAQSLQPEQVAPRIIQVIDETNLFTLKGNVHPLVRKATDQGAASDDLRLDRMLLLLRPSDMQRAALGELLEAQQTRKSPLYHKWLTPAEFGTQFGVAQQDIDTITGWLQAHGFTVESVSQGRNLITFSGTSAQARSAFHTTIHSYKVNGEQHYANASDPKIPAALAPAIAGVVTLNDFSSKPAYKEAGLFRLDKGTGTWVKTSQTPTVPQITTSDPTYHVVGPYDFATIYNVLPLWSAGYDGAGQTIAIVGRSDIHPSDIDSFRSSFGLPAKKLNIIYDGPNPGVTSSEAESDLDVEWSGAVAKGATIDYVVAGTTTATDGTMLSAQYIVDNNIAPVMSISYGECEAEMGTANQFYSALWQQAAAEGITVLASAGDSSAAGCDDENEVEDSVYGLAVSGIASTPYNVAVGGTDFSGNYKAFSTYWNTTNDPTTLQSAKSYIPETPWNASCANPMVLSILGPQVGATTGEELCNSYTAAKDDLIDIVGGGGGQSGYGGTNGVSSYGWSELSVYQGYAKPVWQAGVPGIPADSVRDLPDVSLFAGSGFWGSFYVFCDTDATSTGTCDFTDGGEVLGAGGTSFAAPSFAGIVAIVNQYQAQKGLSAQQGNANYVLYKLAANEYSNSSTLAACGSSGATSGNSCVFYDINQGSNVVPCAFSSPLSPGCTITNSNDGFGLLNGWTANAGYDLASGLGSVNAYNLVTNWNSVSSTFLGSQTILTPTSLSGTYGTPIQVNISVTAASGETGTPSGTAAVVIGSGSALVSGFSGGPFTLNGSGQATGQINGLPTGTDTIAASYSGDANFSISNSSSTQITVAQASTATTLTASRNSLTSGESVTFNLTINTQSTANSPTGNAILKDSTNGSTLGTVAVQSSIDASGNSIATASLNIPASALASGINNITAAYTGDSNYTGSSSSAVLLTNAGQFTLFMSPSSLKLSPGGSGTATVTISPAVGTLLSAVTLTCGSLALPAGMSCSFSPATIPAGSGTSTSVLTVQLTSPLAAQRGPDAPAPEHRLWLFGVSSLAGLACIFMIGPSARRRYYYFSVFIAMVGLLSLSLSCGGKSATSSSASRSSGSTGSGNSTVVTSTSTTLATTGPTALLGSTVTFVSNVLPASGIGTPTGVVTFHDGSTALGTVNLAAGSATYSTTALGVGTHTITAQYGGDTNFSASTSPAQAEDILYTTTLNVTGTDSTGNTGSAALEVTVQ